MRTALITGAGKGMGRAITLRIANEGYKVFAVSRTKADLTTLEAQNPNISGISADITNSQDIHRISEKLKNNPLSVLVLNAGTFFSGTVHEQNEQDFVNMWNLNVMGIYRPLRALIPAMIERKHGHVFITGSIAGRSPRAGAGGYCITKYAVHGLAASLREELREFGIKVSLIVPGATYTTSWEGTDIPLDNFVQANDIAEAVAAALHMSIAAVAEEIVVNPVRPF